MTKSEKIIIPPLPSNNKLRQNIDAKQSSKKAYKKNILIPIIPVIITVIVLVIGVVFLLIRNNIQTQTEKDTAQDNIENTPMLSMITENQTNPETYPYIPQGWSYAINENCNLKIPVPPKQAPYIQKASTDSIFTEGTFWRNYFSANKDDQSSTINAYFVEFSPEEVQPNYDHPARIVVFCKETSISQTAESFFNEFYGPDLIALEKTDTKTMWNKDLSVMKVTVTGEEPELYYYYSDNKRSAIITYRNNEEDQARIKDTFVTDTLYTIYDNLIFLD